MLDMRGDSVVAQLLDEVALPVLPDALRKQPIEGRVDRRIWNSPDVLSLDLGDLMKGPEAFFAFFGGPRPARHNGDERVTVTVFRDERKRRSELEAQLADNKQAQSKLQQQLEASQQQLQAQQESSRAEQARLPAELDRWIAEAVDG